MTSILWLRRDLRVADNPALHAALADGEVIPVFIFAPEEEAPWQPGAASLSWLHHSLAALQANVQQRGSRLIIRHGNSLAVLEALIAETGATAVHWNRLYEPAIIARDKRIKTQLRTRGIRAHSHNGALLAEPWELQTVQGQPYKVFTPFWKNLQTRLPPAPPLAAPAALPRVDAAIVSEPLDSLHLRSTLNWDAGFYAQQTPGEVGALSALTTFLEYALVHYKEGRDRPDHDYISRLSPHLHFGEISPRQIAHSVQHYAHDNRCEAASEGYLRQIAWREFAHHLLFHFPHTPEQPLREKFAAFPWRTNGVWLQAWQQGQTGIPLVDAGMRELWHTGMMHNRVRMIVASLLTKNLQIGWQAGARWFWDTLVDANLANNTLGWQWVAGCGADAAPFFRIFNPSRQAERFDPEARYIRQWVPELGKLANTHIIEPWKAPAAALSRAGVVLGVDYPNPIVDLGESRRAALAAYQSSVK